MKIAYAYGRPPGVTSLMSVGDDGVKTVLSTTTILFLVAGASILFWKYVVNK